MPKAVHRPIYDLERHCLMFILSCFNPQLQTISIATKPFLSLQYAATKCKHIVMLQTSFSLDIAVIPLLFSVFPLFWANNGAEERSLEFGFGMIGAQHFGQALRWLKYNVREDGGGG